MKSISIEYPVRYDAAINYEAFRRHAGGYLSKIGK
jgi:hypothetical protein